MEATTEILESSSKNLFELILSCQQIINHRLIILIFLKLVNFRILYVCSFVGCQIKCSLVHFFAIVIVLIFVEYNV